MRRLCMLGSLGSVAYVNKIKRLGIAIADVNESIKQFKLKTYKKEHSYPKGSYQKNFLRGKKK